MNTMMINALCPGVQVTRRDLNEGSTDIKLVLEPVAWTGVTVSADKVPVVRADNGLHFEWRVRINWPSCGADVEQTEAFARLLKAAVYVAGELMKEKTGTQPEPDSITAGTLMTSIQNPRQPAGDFTGALLGVLREGARVLANTANMVDPRPRLPEGIDWTEPGVWEDFRATYTHCRGHFFLFCGVRFSPSFAKLLLDAYAAEPLPDYGDLMTVTEFKNAVDCGMFTDYDGSGEYATATHRLGIPVELDALDMTQTHVLWFNK